MTDLTLFDTPDLERRVRSTDAESSWSAAAISHAGAGELRAWVLRYVAALGPVTDDQIYAAYQAAGGRRTPQRLRTARMELVHPKHGSPKLQEHPIVGTSALGHPARQWVAHE